MALDYVKTLRDMEGQEALQPRVKITPEQATAQEANARSIDAENGRFGRFVDQQGKWATAWQAPGRSTPIVPPRFIAPAQLKRNQSRDLVLQPPDGDALLVSPQQWVVVYDGDGEAIVADDEDFRRVMTREDRVHVEPEEAEAEAAPEYRHPQQIDPKVLANQPALQPQQLVPTVSMDGFVAQVLLDNQRLRIELAAVSQQRDKVQAQIRGLDETLSRTIESNDRLAARGRWMWSLIAKAMGYNSSDIIGPNDREIEAFLVEVSDRMRSAAPAPGNGQDLPPDVRQAGDSAAEATDRTPDATPKPPPSLTSERRNPKRSPMKGGSDEAA